MRCDKLRFVIWWIVYIAWLGLFLVSTSVVHTKPRNPLSLAISILCLVINFFMSDYCSIKKRQNAGMRHLITLQIAFTLVVYFRFEISSMLLKLWG